MATGTIHSGICGFQTTVLAEAADNWRCRVRIESDCPNVQNLAASLDEVDALAQISFRGGRPSVLELAERHLPHASCPVPCGIIKAIEVACGLALPATASIELSDGSFGRAGR